MRLIIALIAACTIAAPASAKSYQVKVSANVPAECELSTSGGITAAGPSLFRITNIRQFCNTGYVLEVRHAELQNQAVVMLRDAAVPLTSGTTVITANGHPVNGSADLLLATGNAADAQLFAQTMYLAVSPSGV